MQGVPSWFLRSYQFFRKSWKSKNNEEEMDSKKKSLKILPASEIHSVTTLTLFVFVFTFHRGVLAQQYNTCTACIWSPTFPVKWFLGSRPEKDAFLRPWIVSPGQSKQHWARETNELVSQLHIFNPPQQPRRQLVVMLILMALANICQKYFVIVTIKQRHLYITMQLLKLPQQLSITILFPKNSNTHDEASCLNLSRSEFGLYVEAHIHCLEIHPKNV